MSVIYLPVPLTQLRVGGAVQGLVRDERGAEFEAEEKATIVMKHRHLGYFYQINFRHAPSSLYHVRKTTKSPALLSVLSHQL